jgi:hypothetical protein
MSTRDKLIARFKTLPTDFTFDELTRLFNTFGFEINTKGKTSGSRFLFVKGDLSYGVHKPHPSGIIKTYVMRQILTFFIENNFITNNNQ